MKRAPHYTKNSILAGMIFVLWSLAVLLPSLHIYNLANYAASRGILLIYIGLNIVVFCYALWVFLLLIRARMRTTAKDKRSQLRWRILLYVYVLVGLLVAIYVALFYIL